MSPGTRVTLVLLWFWVAWTVWALTFTVFTLTAPLTSYPTSLWVSLFCHFLPPHENCFCCWMVVVDLHIRKTTYLVQWCWFSPFSNEQFRSVLVKLDKFSSLCKVRATSKPDLGICSVHQPTLYIVKWVCEGPEVKTAKHILHCSKPVWKNWNLQYLLSLLWIQATVSWKGTLLMCCLSSK